MHAKNFVAVAVSLLSIAQGGARTMVENDTVPQVTLSPSPMFTGQRITITAGANMKLSILLDGVAHQVTTDQDGKAYFTPSTSGSIFVSDPSGAWGTASGIVLP